MSKSITTGLSPSLANIQRWVVVVVIGALPLLRRAQLLRLLQKRVIGRALRGGDYNYNYKPTTE